MSKEFASELSRLLQGRAPSDQRLLFVGLLNKFLPPDRRAVLVGGLAVEFYTSGGYVTGDIDLVGDKEAVHALLLQGGFKADGRAFYNPALGLMAEIPSMFLRPSETPVQAEFEGLPFWIVSVEDVIIDRLLAAEYWRSPTDWEQAILMFHAHKDRIRVDQLTAKAKANDVHRKLQELLKTGARRERP